MAVGSIDAAEQTKETMQVMAQAQQQLVKLQEKMVKVAVTAKVTGLGENVDTSR